MHYTAIIKDGGLFIPNVFTELDDGSSHLVQVEIDIEAVREQLNDAPTPKKASAKIAKKVMSKSQKKASQTAPSKADLSTRHKNAVSELEALDDAELSEILKAYINDSSNDEKNSLQISLENL